MLPIRKVVLYQHGVGYFERTGLVKDMDVVTLSFKVDHMNDILKSITVIDSGGGVISAISYDSSKPLEHLLNDISIRIPDSNSIVTLLSQIKGAKVAIELGGETFVGTVVGLDSSTTRKGEVEVQTQYLSLMVDNTLKWYELFEIKSIKLLDAQVSKDLEFYLNILIGACKKDNKNVVIFASGSGERELTVSYILEAPVWKTAYRVVLSQKERPFIQGWAVIDNMMEEDWEDVELILVAGLPISFIHDLYNPRYKRRPVVEVPKETAAVPVNFEEGSDYGRGAMPEAERDSFQCQAAPAMARPIPLPQATMAPAPMVDRKRLAASVKVSADTRDAGNLFEYRIQNRITVKRNQSALVPIVQSDFDAKKVSVYNPEANRLNPMACLEFTNSTGLTLEGGPLTVFDEGLYVGEAMIEFLKPDEKRFVSYSVDLEMRVDLEADSKNQDIHYVKVVKGTMYTHYMTYRETAYHIKNKSKDSKELILEHRMDRDYKLFETPNPIETTPNHYRFKFLLHGKEENSFAVKERRENYQSYYLGNMTSDQIEFYLKCKYFNRVVADTLNKMIDLKGTIAELDRETQDCQARIDAIFTDQERIRSNLKTLGAGAEEKRLKERLVSKLEGQEDAIEEIKARLEGISQEKTEKNHLIENYINDLNCETTLAAVEE